MTTLQSNSLTPAQLRTENRTLTFLQWWPNADFNELRIVCFLAIWLFLWDDALDEPTGEYRSLFEAAQEYRAVTTQFLLDTLGLSTSKDISTVVTYSMLESFKDFGQGLINTLEYFLGSSSRQKNTLKPSRFVYGIKAIGEHLKTAFKWSLGIAPSSKIAPKASHPVIESFRVIGDEIRAAYTVGMQVTQNRKRKSANPKIEQRQNFFQDMNFYIETTEVEQRFHLDGKIPTIEEYWEVRMGTSAVAACLAMIE